MSVTAPFPYTIDADAKRRNSMAVYRLWFGKKYFIFKGMKLAQSIENVSAQIKREIQVPKENSIMIKLVAYVRSARVTIMDVEVLKETDDQVDLLLTEYEWLQASKKDEDCLNTDFVNNEHFPRWMAQTAINEFHKRLQGIKPPDKHKYLKMYLRTSLVSIKKEAEREEVVEKLFKYITERFR